MNGLDMVETGAALPEQKIAVTRKMIIMGATASRDWQLQHHDKDRAQGAGLPDIIMNNYTQAGLISRFITDWAGPAARIGKLRFAMRKPLCPDCLVTISGRVTNIIPGDDEMTWLELDITLSEGDKVFTTSSARVALPASPASRSPWQCPALDWAP